MLVARINLALKISIAVLTVLVLGVVVFADHQLSSTAQETAKLKAESELAKEQVQAYTLTKNRVQQLDYVDELANKVLPVEEDQSIVVAELTQFALRSNLTITQLTFEDSTQPSTALKSTGSTTQPRTTIPSGVKIKSASISLAPDARYADVITFLRTIEDNRRRAQVTDVNLTPKPGSDLLSQATIKLNLYYGINR